MTSNCIFISHAYQFPSLPDTEEELLLEVVDGRIRCHDQKLTSQPRLHSESYSLKESLSPRDFR